MSRAANRRKTADRNEQPWQKQLWDAVGRYDVDAAVTIADSTAVRDHLERARRRGRPQLWLGDTAPLHLAAFCGHNDLVLALANRGFDVDSYNVYDGGLKVTPLHWAVYKNKMGTVRLLLELGADPTLFGRWGSAKGTPLDFARHRKHEEIVAVLRQFRKSEDQDVFLSYGESAFNADDAAMVRRQLAVAEARRVALLEQLSLLEAKTLELTDKLERMGSTEAIPTETSRRLEDAEDPDLLCPVCLDVPRFKVFSCVECDHMLCASCLSRIDACPCCRISFEVGVAPPRRNRWAEKLIAIKQPQ